MARKPTDNANTPSSKPEILTAEIRRIVNQAAHRIVRRTCMSKSDIPDITQTLLLAVVAAVNAFDPQRGTWHAFARQVIRRASNNFLRKRFTAKRDPRKCASLHLKVLVEDEVTAELAQQITYVQLAGRTGGRYRKPQEMSELKMDLQIFIDSLPEYLRQLALDLMVVAKSEIPQLHKRPRTTIQSRIRRLRTLAEDHHLQSFL